jgi:hypothetical protein
MIFNQPIEIYAIWQKEFTEGKTIASNIYNLFCRNVLSPFDASIGIPVYYRYEKTEKGSPMPIETTQSKRCFIVILLDDNFLLDEKIQDYVDSLIELESKKDNIRIVPISFTKHFGKARKSILNKNVIRVHDEKLLKSLGQDANGFLITSLLHEIARFLMNIDTNSENTPAPIRLFISHSKHDKTLKYAIEFKAYVDSKSQLKTFFDVNDIEYGFDFEKELKKGIAESALVVFQSDSYASREWCRIEAITAKKNNCPVVVVNAIENGEKRSFPYLGNVPTIRLNNNYKEILDLTLERVVYNLYKKELMAEIANMYRLDIDYKTSSLPELFDIIKIKKLMVQKGHDFSVILYPDPPLGSEELLILNEMSDDMFFITPNQLPTLEKTHNGK